jgi:hypothetical protein
MIQEMGLGNVRESSVRVCSFPPFECNTFLYSMLGRIEVGYLMEDYLGSVIFSKSSLTETQLKTIVASRAGGGMEKAVMSKSRSVSRGAFHRTLRQGQHNIESSLYTVILVEYLGLVPTDCLSQIAKLCESLSRVKERHPTNEQIKELLGAMEGLVQEYSGKRKLLV